MVFLSSVQVSQLQVLEIVGNCTVFLLFSKHTARNAMCQAIFTMKIAKKYGIMVNVNKTVFLCCPKLNNLLEVHKTRFGFL